MKMEKSPFNFKIEKMDGTIIDMHERNIFVSTFRISSPRPKYDTDTVDGRHGVIKSGTILEGRKVKTLLVIEGKDYMDFDMFRDELFKIFNPLEDFYIIRDVQPKKRMKVSIANEYDLEYVWLELGEMELEFEIESVFLESIGTTLNPLAFEVEKWQTGQGLTTENPSYTHDSITFKIYNAGDVMVDPRQMPLKIEFKKASDNLNITNLTTGDVWQYNGSSVANDTITLDGIRSLKNGISIFGDTNKKLITIAPGWNDFEITGSSDFLITFDFRFYYF